MRTSNVSVTWEPGDALGIRQNPARTTTYGEGADAWTSTHKANVQVTLGQVTMFFDDDAAFNRWLLDVRRAAHEIGFTGAVDDLDAIDPT